jgi:hypothetical protein
MGTRRIVQCFGTLVRPRKPARPCRRKFVWTARGSSRGNFGSKGVQACPHCGTLPDLGHPVNRWLNSELSQEKVVEILQRDYNLDGTKKDENSS